MESQSPNKSARRKPKGTIRADAMVTRQKIFELLLQGRKHRDIASELNLTVKQIYKYTSDPTFKQELNQYHRDTLKAMSLRSDRLLEQALNLLETLLATNNAPYQAKVNAARLAIDATVKLDENSHLAEEIETLKEAIEARKDIFDALPD